MDGRVDRIDLDCRDDIEAGLLEAEGETAAPCEQIDTDRPMRFRGRGWLRAEFARTEKLRLDRWLANAKRNGRFRLARLLRLCGLAGH